MNDLSVHSGATETLLPPIFVGLAASGLAVFFRCAFEGWSDGHWPGVGPMGNPLKAGVPVLNASALRIRASRGIFRVLTRWRARREGHHDRLRYHVRNGTPRSCEKSPTPATTSWRIRTQWT